jgi:hypothetical protein
MSMSLSRDQLIAVAQTWPSLHTVDILIVAYQPGSLAGVIYDSRRMKQLQSLARYIGEATGTAAGTVVVETVTAELGDDNNVLVILPTAEGAIVEQRDPSRKRLQHRRVQYWKKHCGLDLLPEVHSGQATNPTQQSGTPLLYPQAAGFTKAFGMTLVARLDANGTPEGIIEPIATLAERMGGPSQFTMIHQYTEGKARQSKVLRFHRVGPSDGTDTGGVC